MPPINRTETKGKSMSNNVVETLIGAVVLGVAVAFLVFAFSRTDVGTVSGYEVLAKFDRVDGVAVGTDVRMSGIKIGTVVDQVLDPSTFKAVVRMAIRPDIELPLDSSATISTEGLLGGTYISLTPGGEIDALEDGDEIEYTQGSVDLMGLIGRAVYGAGGGGDTDS